MISTEIGLGIMDSSTTQTGSERLGVISDGSSYKHPVAEYSPDDYMPESESEVILRDDIDGLSLYEHNDLEMAAALMTMGFHIVKVSRKFMKTRRKKNREVHFGFEDNQSLRQAILQYMNRTMLVDARTLQNNQADLMSYVLNYNRDSLNKAIERSLSK